MPNSQILWFAGSFITSITINLNLIRVITDKGVQRPVSTTVFINILLSLVGGYFNYQFVSAVASGGFVLFNILSFLIIVVIVTRRDAKAINLSQVFFSSFRKIDLQIIHILSELNTQPGPGILKSIRRAQRWTLSELSNILGLNNKYKAHLSILVPINLRFHVIAYEGIENYKISIIEEQFNYGTEIKSVAGHAMRQRKTILINDLSDDKNEDAQKWIQVEKDEPPQGSLLVVPIMRGIGFTDTEPIALVCISSEKKNAFDPKSIHRIMAFYGLKIEILQNCWEIASRSIPV